MRYEDVPNETLQDEREEWEDDIKSFVPAFAPVKAQEIGDRSFDAHLTTDQHGETHVRLIDASETITFQFPLAGLFNFDVEQFHTESWEMYFGLLDVKRQLTEIMGEFDKRLEAASEIMGLRTDAPPVDDSL